jgi:ParB/RepB/Spo0J family partition protein
MAKRPNIEALPVGVIRGNAFLSAAFTQDEVNRWKSVFERHGPVTPLVVRPAGDGSYLVINGERELEAVRELKVSKTDAVVVPLASDSDAHKLSLQLLSLRSLSNHLEEALIIQEILKDTAVSQANLAKLCGRSISWVSKRLNLVQSLESAVVGLVSQRVLHPATAQEIAKLPPSKQHPFACRVVADQIPKSVVEKLISVFNAPQTSDELRRQILASPKGALDRIQAATTGLGRSDTPIEDKQLKKACHLLERLFDQTISLLTSNPPAQQQSGSIAWIRELTEGFLARLASLTASMDFPQGK